MADDAPKRYRENLQGEVDGAALYCALADVEADEKLAEVYRRVATVEDRHAEYWRGELRRLGASIPRLTPSFRSRGLGWLAHRFGPAFVLPTINTLEQTDSGIDDHQLEAVKGGLPALDAPVGIQERAVEELRKAASGDDQRACTTRKSN